MRKPIAVASNLGNIYPETNLIFSPDDKSILTGTPVKKGSGEKGCLVFLNSEDLTEERRTPIGEGSVVRVFWHSRINQVGSPYQVGHFTPGPWTFPHGPQSTSSRLSHPIRPGTRPETV
jgi:hypothetical protein